MLQKVSAIVIRSRKFRESSSLLTFFSRELGKVTVVAHGRGKKGGQSSIHQIFCKAEVVISIKESRDLQTLSRAESTQLPRHLLNDFDAMQHGMAVCETIDRVSEHGSPSADVYDLLEAYVQALDSPNSMVLPIWLRIRFLLKYAELNGFGFQVASSSVAETTGCDIDLASGTAATQSTPRTNCFPMRPDSWHAFAALNQGKIPDSQAASTVQRDILSMLNAYFELHTGHIISPRSQSFEADLGNW